MAEAEMENFEENENFQDQQFEVDASGDHFDADLDEKIETNGDNNEDEQQDFEQQQEEQQLEVEQQEEEETHQTESENTEGHSKYIVNMHGLPYSISEEEILKFLDGCNVEGGTAGIHFCYGDDGRLNGDAFVELESEADLKAALTKNKKHIGRRYIDVFQVDQKEMEYVLKRNSLDAVNKRIESGDVECVVRLRGLPFGCTKEEIANFFLGMAIAPGGILIVTDHVGRAAGDGFVQFTSPDLVDRALEKHKEKIGHRYIEVFRSSTKEMQKRAHPPSLMNTRPGPYDRPDFGGGRMGRYGGRGGNIKGFGGGYGGSMYGSGRDYGGGRDYGSSRDYGGGRDYGGYGGGPGGRYGRDPYESRRFGGGGMSGRADYRSGRLRDFHSSTGHFIYMRGLPYSASEKDIIKFFSPVIPVRVCFEYGDDGRPSGNANVDFDSEPASREAMKKHRNMMEHRYIELFLNGVGSSSR